MLVILQVDALLKTLELQESVMQGAFCSVQLSGDWTHQVQRCAASILQSVSCENVPWQSSIGPRHDKASGYR